MFCVVLQTGNELGVRRVRVVVWVRWQAEFYI